jgi:hypothetical protein
MTTRSITLLISAALSILILLSGCLMSQEPLLTAKNSDRPLPAHFRISPDNTPGNSAPVDLTDDNAYIFTDPADSADREKLYFKKIADNIYAVSRAMIEKETGTLKGYQYGYMRIAENKIVFQWPDCAAFDADDVKKLGVEITKEDGSVTSCRIPSVEVLGALLMNYMDDPKNAERIKSREEDNTFFMITK